MSIKRTIVELIQTLAAWTHGEGDLIGLLRSWWHVSLGIVQLD